MVFHSLDEVRVHVVGLAGDAEGSVALVAPGAPGDLADLLRMKEPGALAVELAQSGEGDMVDIHVQAHSDRIGGHQEIDLARLIERDLRIARARAQRAHDDSRSPALPPDQFGDRVDLLGAEGHDRGAAGQAGQFLRSGVGEGAESLPGYDLRMRQ